ncbi:MAG: STAS-like domain-containing protein [Cyanobacteria bacterium SBLK]|nr:STAS-like domain-containing protein [Cyanobacteria bacterium SBLK]
MKFVSLYFIKSEAFFLKYFLSFNTFGFLGIRASKTKTWEKVPFLSHDNNCTTVDFQIDFDKEISIKDALGGYEPTNLRLENIQDDSDNIVYKFAEKSSGTGTRQSGLAIKNEILNISNQTNSLIVLDFKDISIVSSSFADELIGKLVVKFGFIGFTQRFKLTNMNEFIQTIINRSVFQRISQNINIDVSGKISQRTQIKSEEIRKKFIDLASQWTQEVEGLSSTVEMAKHPLYQEIIEMGETVIPLLLEDLQQNPLYWLSALRQITQGNPILPEQRGKVKQMAEAWLNWGRQKGYIA